MERQEHQRRDNQGLRAITCSRSSQGHLLHRPAGGFVGVDVFFVISGFMITGQLLREHEKTGWISFVNFYRQRIRRLRPASLLVLACTVVTARLLPVLHLPVPADRRGRDRGLVSAGNWRMALQGTDCCQSRAAPSPLQHSWSLGVE